MKYAAVIAAAGLSSRMRDFKPLLCLGDKTIIAQVVQSFRAVGVEEIVVVTGYRSDVLQKHLDALGVRGVENLRFAETKMYDSLCLGLRALPEGYDRIFLTPGDVPLVREETLRAMLAVDAAAIRPVCQGESGHPILVTREVAQTLLTYQGGGGLRGALDALGPSVVDVTVDDVGITLDADTPEDLKRLRRRQMENRSDGRLWADIQIQIARGDTILTPETAQFLEMIGHIGSIQNACGCMHMSYTKGWKLLNHMEQELGYPLVERYPGGANGGGSALTERGRRLLGAYQTYREVVWEAVERLFSQIFTDDLSGERGM